MDNKREVDNLLSSFGVDYISNVRTKYQQLFTNYAHKTLGNRVDFYSTTDSSACGYALDNTNKILASVLYGRTKTETGWKESLRFVGCNQENYFTFYLKRDGEALPPLDADKLIHELEFLDLRKGETQRVVQFAQKGSALYNIVIRKTADKVREYAYIYRGENKFTARRYEDQKKIRIEFYYPNVDSNLNERVKRIFLFYNKEKNEARYRWPNSNLYLSKRQFDQYIQSTVRSTVAYYFGGVHMHNLLSLPETRVVAAATSVTQFYRDLIENIDILKSGQIAPVINFLEKKKEDIEEGRIVIQEF